MSTPADRLRMAKAILDFEARRDSKGNLMVYNLPANDGGGAFEVAGINEKYDREMAYRLRDLVNAGKYQEAELLATNYIASNTDNAAKYTKVPAIESYSRDILFNRGEGGLRKTLQHALSVEVDGQWGPISTSAMTIAETQDPAHLLANMRDAREWYERNVVGYRANFWQGLTNRWNKSLAVAKTFSLASTVTAPVTKPAPTSVTPAKRSWVQALVDLLGSFLKSTSTGFVPKPTTSVPTAASLNVPPPWFTWAAKQVGFHETGVNLGIENYIALAKTGSLGDPWCAIFANAGLETSGLRGTRSAMARSFESDPNFVKLAGPAIGAITTMWRGSPSAGTGHVFFYAGENNKGILALGGNQSDQVCRQYEPRNRVVGYYWPKGWPLPKVGVVIVDDSGATTGSET
jgi:uncharacterized protein (TIGR02594 family)